MSVYLTFLPSYLVSAGYEYEEKAVETRAAEVSKFLDMLRSVSSDGSDRSKPSHPEWKVCYVDCAILFKVLFF